ncbi:MAG: glycosyltransferase, partial [Chitinivibrionales bacterium]|nr:glycosyltransferase [Chitinivibrionales bacterium]
MPERNGGRARMTEQSTSSVVIVNYNGGELLAPCVESYLSQSTPVVELVIVDNCSTDDSIALTRERFPDIPVIVMPENLGYGAAINAGLRATTGDIVVLSNNDLRVDDGWLMAVTKCLRSNPQCGLVASKVLYMADPSKINSVGTLLYGDLTAVNKGLDEMDRGQYDTREEVFGAYGAVMAFRREVFTVIGEFDEEYFLFKEEDDITLRMHRAGWHTLYEPTARVFHRRSLNTGLYSPLKLYYSERNRIWNVAKHLPLRCLVTTLPHVSARYWGNMMPKSNTTSDKAKAVARASKVKLLTTIVRAWLDAFLRLPHMLGKRRQYRAFSK